MVSSETLAVKAVHLKEKANAQLHHTSDFELVHLEPPTPVLRRGQPFQLDLTLNRPYDQSTDIVRLAFSFGKKPDVMKGTRKVNTVTDRDNCLTDLQVWDIYVVSSKAENLSLEVRTPVDSPVGIWQLTIETTTSGSNKEPNTYHLQKDIYLLFNPWLKEDTVYMEEQELLDEYVNNDVGKIWCGDEKSCRGREWIFGQFDACVLPACQYMLEKSGLKDAFRGDPVRISRFISKIVNSNDDDGGVLAGRWDGKYADGIAPSAWTGSVPILYKYMKTKGMVHYGQCWVFAGVVTTVCRALGIPSRVVTNIVSAHDTNASLSIDRFYDPKKKGFDSQDSIWNFHVWNDVWMARPDLPKGYGGWQAIDATPQERSDGMFQCGPTSLQAIKEGAVGYNYDVQFMLATVNADVMQWIEDKESDLGWRKLQSDEYEIGRMILTKAPFLIDANGDRDREDVTKCYKDKEGTRGERLALLRAARSTTGARKLYAIPDAAKEDVKFELVDLERVKIGEPFSLIVYIENKSTQPRSIQAILSVRSVYYNGVNARLVKEVPCDFVIHPGQREELRLTVPADQYQDKLVEYSMMKLCAMAKVKETKQIWAEEDDFQVLKPTIDIKIEDKLIVGKPATIVLSFTNPLAKVLTKCKLNYAGPGLEKNITLSLGDVCPHKVVRAVHKIVPRKVGKQHIVATFVSKQLTDITGSTILEVFDKED